MEEKKEQTIKRLVIDLPLRDHQEIRNWSTYRNVTMKQYVIEAVAERIKRDTQFYK